MSHNSAPRSNDAPSCSPRRLWPTRSERRWLWLLLGLGLGARLVLIVALRTYEIPARDDHYLFGHEYGRIARSLACGRGYASPYGLDNSGLTTKGCPLFPFYLSLLFRAFGVYSPEAAAAVHVTNSVASVATALVAFVVGKRLFGAREGWIAAALFAFDPSALWYSTNLIWETSLSGLGMAGLLVVFLWLRDHLSVRAGALSGLIAGVIAHLHICALPVSAMCALWLLARARGRRRAALRALLAMGVVGAVVIAPWSVRSSLIEGRLVILRGNFVAFVSGALAQSKESHLADHESSPDSGKMKRLYNQLGQRGFSEYYQRQIRAQRRQTTAGFLRGVAIRSTRFWIGDVWRAREWYGSARVKLPFSIEHAKIVAHSLPALLALVGFVVAWRRRQDVWLLFAQIAGFFPVYALLHCRLPRYRFPIQAALMVLSSVALVSGATWVRQRWGRGGSSARSGREDGLSSESTLD